MNTTPGEWIVIPATEQISEGCFLHEIYATGVNDSRLLIALVPNLADAALMSSAQKMINALTQIIEKLNTSKEPIDLEELNQLASEAIEKIAAEAGEI